MDRDQAGHNADSRVPKSPDEVAVSVLPVELAEPEAGAN
jgi:hypothetical protein